MTLSLRSNSSCTSSPVHSMLYYQNCVARIPSLETNVEALTCQNDGGKMNEGSEQALTDGELISFSIFHSSDFAVSKVNNVYVYVTIT